MFRKVPCIRVEDGTFTPIERPVAEEQAVSLIVNGRNLMTALVSPEAREEFIIGFLFTEQIIRSLDEIESIRREKNSFSVLTTNPFRVLGQKKIILSGCGGSSSFLDTRRLPKIVSSLVVTPDAIRSALKEMAVYCTEPPVTYQAGLVPPEGTPQWSEDIGRHHALDKVIGLGLRHHLPLTESFVVSSGSVSSEMVRKCLVAGIPLIASPGATTLAIEIAEKTGLSIVEIVPGDALHIYTHPEHIQGAP